MVNEVLTKNIPMSENTKLASDFAVQIGFKELGGGTSEV
jgi:hypothetical protein